MQQDQDGSWRGTITCDCGWSDELEGYASPEAARIAVLAASIWHSDGGVRPEP